MWNSEYKCRVGVGLQLVMTKARVGVRVKFYFTIILLKFCILYCANVERKWRYDLG